MPASAQPSAASMNDSTMAGPALSAAATPVSENRPAPMIAPMPSTIRFHGPKTRFILCSPPSAQALLAVASPAQAPVPALDDKAGWYARVEQMNTDMATLMRGPRMALPVQSKSEVIGGVDVFVAEPETIPAENQDKVLLYFHGG